MKKWVSCALALLPLLLVAEVAHAHSLVWSRSVWKFEGRQPVATFVVPALDVRKAAGSGAIESYVASHVQVGESGDGCVLRTTQVISSDVNNTKIRVAFECAREPAPRIAVQFLFAENLGHMHHARVAGSPREAILTFENRVVDFGNRDDSGNESQQGEAMSLGAAVIEGVRHVAIGFDHIAFIVALTLIGFAGRASSARTRVRRSLGVVTGFTVGHSITLTLSSLGVFQVDGKWIEVLVGVSIVFAAISGLLALRPELRRHALSANATLHVALVLLDSDAPGVAILGSLLFTTSHLLLVRFKSKVDSQSERTVILAALFGLIHGFAFASAFASLVGAAPDWQSLFGFNLGVELGQVAIVGIMLACIGIVPKRFNLPVRALATAVILALGISWTFTRAVG